MTDDPQTHSANPFAEFDDIRPYNDDEVKEAVGQLLHDRQFALLIKGFAPWMPKMMMRALARTAFLGVNSTSQFQLRFMKPIVKHIIKRHSDGCTFDHTGIAPGEERYTFVSNHRDIVLDSAILDILLYDAHFPTTCEIGIGDNLLIYPWIRTLVRLNKAFTVKRGLTPHELIRSSQLMSRYIHHAIRDKHENVWIAQREGRAKDSSDHTQDSILKMLAMGGEGTPAESLKELHIVPLTISYEYDPCDYLKAKEFQLKRDDPHYKKSKRDDLDNMKTGIFGPKGHIHYQTAAPLSTWVDEYAHLPRTEFFAAVAARMDKEIHSGYRLWAGNYVAADLLSGHYTHVDLYTHTEKVAFERYIKSRIALIDIPNRDDDFLRERLLTMYANPVANKEQAAQ